MKKRTDWTFIIGIGSLVLLSQIVLYSIAPSLFPQYIFYVILGFIFFIIFWQFGFGVVSVFSKHIYIGSIIFLLLPLLVGQLTRGTVRWINLGVSTIQPAEIVRPFLILFFANFLTSQRITLKRFIQAIILLILPVYLILIQPSLGVSVLTTVGFIGVVLAINIPKKYLLYGLAAALLLIPLIWLIMAPYQKERVMTFLNPSSDPYGKGYNSTQSVITTGSGKLFGRGLGKGVQTQLSFLPERQTDFIFASISEELGFLGGSLVLILTSFVLFKLISFSERADSFAARAYLSGFALTYLAQVIIHVGMNLGLLPITGVPLPLISAGGSSLLATFIALGLSLSTVAY